MQSSQENAAPMQQLEAPNQPASRFHSSEEAAFALVMLLMFEERIDVIERGEVKRDDGE